MFYWYFFTIPLFFKIFSNVKFTGPRGKGGSTCGLGPMIIDSCFLIWILVILFHVFLRRRERQRQRQRISYQICSRRGISFLKTARQLQERPEHVKAKLLYRRITWVLAASIISFRVSFDCHPPQGVWS